MEQTTGKKQRGQLVRWNDDKGFGFIKHSSGSDVFIHISELKQMSRKPKVGDFIHFDIETQADGKIRARQCRIEGVMAKPRANSRRHRSTHRVGSSRATRRMYTVIAIIVIAAGMNVYDRLKPASPILEKTTPSRERSQRVKSIPPKLQQSFRCDGRQHCSQMTSRAEAEYFIKHCPNTKMDGDRDGIPCENDSRF